MKPSFAATPLFRVVVIAGALFESLQLHGAPADCLDWRWVQRNPANSPPPRSGHAMAYDSHRNVTVLFGGWQTNNAAGNDFTAMGDLWEWDGANWTQRMANSTTEGWATNTQGYVVPSYQGRPVCRAKHNLVYDSARRRMVLFGGEARVPPQIFQMFLNDVWEWDGTQWYFRTTNGPAPRLLGAMAYDSDRRVSVLTGGFLNAPDPIAGAVWEWNGSQWTMIMPTNGPARNHWQDYGGMTYDSVRRKIVFGPTAPTSGHRWAFWLWDGSEWEGHEQYVAELWNLQYGDLVFDSSRERSIWFGGTYGAITNHTGFFDGEKWEVMTNAAAYPPPSPRTYHAMAYNSRRRATVMFGGDNYWTPTTQYGDTWELVSVNTQPPTVLCPAGITVDADRPCGARVEFFAFASDNCGGPVSSTFSPRSGSVFPVGDTLVTCTAADTAGNTAQCTFVVTVRPGQPFPVPIISRVSPQLVGLPNGMRVGAQITLQGRNFTPDDEVIVGGQPLRYPVFVSSVELQGQTPELGAGSHSVEIRRCGQFSARFDGSIHAFAMPVDMGTPGTSYSSGGSFITLTGQFFTAETKIRVGFHAGDGVANMLRDVNVSADGTTLTGRLPALPPGELPGPRSLIVEDPQGNTVLQRTVTYLPNLIERDPQLISLRSLQAASTQPVAATWRNGFPGALSARVQVAGATPEDRARSFVGTHRNLLRLQHPEFELSASSVRLGTLDNVKMAQNYRGIPIHGAEIVATFDGEELVAMTGNLLPLAELDQSAFNTNPTLTAEEAIAIVKVAESIDVPRETLEPSFALIIYDSSIFAESERNPRLAWRITMNRSAYISFVDAHDGEIIGRRPVEQSHGGDLDDFNFDLQDAEGEANARDDHCFNLSDDVTIADEDDWNTDYNNDLDAVWANWFARDCWAWFHRVFAWHSYDNDSSELEVFVHSSMNPTNVASWSPDCELMQFADGAVDYEVMVHEFTHGVISSTSKLDYQNQSGALNEHYADAMAVLADRNRGELETPGQPPNWTLVESRRPPQRTGTVRDFQNPPARGDPDQWNNRTNFSAMPSGANDFGGVHSNSGIANKAAYLMIEGGTFNGYLVRGMGEEKVLHLKFFALRGLPAGAFFIDARVFEIAAVESFAKTGHRGYTYADVCTVRNAWAAVGVGMGDSNCDGVEDNSHDIDGDLIPNSLDNCPTVPNPNRANADGDRYGDACDNCPFVANDGQEDYDNDLQGDVCDTDRDGDGCLNINDQDPDSELHRIGTSLSATCQQRSAPHYGFAGGNSDNLFPPPGDKADCEDLDDDNDGIPDFGPDGVAGNADDDPCPVGVLRDAVPGSDCGVIGRDCPRASDTWWQTCLGGGCNQFYARIIDKINPDPTRETLINDIRIVNQTLYMAPAAGANVANIASAIATRRIVGAQAHMGQPDEERRIEIWSRGSETEPPHLVAVVGDFQLNQLQVGDVSTGALLAFTPATTNQPATLAATWHVGADPATLSQDLDADGLPDGWERRHGFSSSDAADAAGDLDNDGMSNSAEFQAGTNPRSAESRVALLTAHRQTTGMEIQFLGPSGRRVQLEKAQSLGGTWSSTGDPVHLQGGVTVLTDAVTAGSPQGFYRVRVLTE